MMGLKKKTVTWTRKMKRRKSKNEEASMRLQPIKEKKEESLSQFSSIWPHADFYYGSQLTLAQVGVITLTRMGLLPNKWTG